MKKVNKIVAISFLAISLTSCASDGWLAKQFGYTPDKYVPKDKIGDYVDVTSASRKETIVKYDTLVPSRAAVLSSNGLTEDPKLVSAWQNYVSGKGNYIVTGQNKKVYPYDPYSEPTLTCGLGYVCTITLEKGEVMTGTNKAGLEPLWNITDAETGSGENITKIISLKPIPLQGQSFETVNGASTNLVIPTNRRVYRFNLVITTKPSYEDISFYYPNETIEYWNDKLKEKYEKYKAQERNGDSLATNEPTYISMTNANGDIVINTDYTIKGDKVAWKPINVFDNGAKTVIQMPDNISQLDLPTVMVIKDTKDQEIINPRYRNGKFILDGIYKTIILFNTASDNTTKVQVTITNNKYPK